VSESVCFDFDADFGAYRFCCDHDLFALFHDTNDDDDDPVDPWAALDPHDPGTSQARPIRKGRTYKLPRQLQLRKRRAPKKIQEQQQQQEGSEGGKEQKNEGDSWVGQDGRLM